LNFLPALLPQKDKNKKRRQRKREIH